MPPGIPVQKTGTFRETRMNCQSQPFVSVVTPVYNGEEYLRDCIESVLAQTSRNWEYIIVNNCSTDSSLEIAEEYVAKDPRIRVYDNPEFLRVIPNHNNALRRISPHSKYTKMVFADDWLFPECIARMVEVAESHPAIGIVGSYALQGTKVAWDGLPYPSTYLPGKAVCRAQFLRLARLPGGRPYVFGTATSMLFRSDLVRQRDSFFNESNLHADTEICYDLLREHDYGFVHQVLSFMRVREGSLSSFSERFNTNLAGHLYDVMTYAPSFLTPQETERAVRLRLRGYYRFLAESLITPGWDPQFWQFHARKLRELGYPLSLVRMIRGMAGVLMGGLLNPKMMVGSLWRRRRQLSNLGG